MNISKTATLPYKTIKGNLQERKKLANSLNDKVFNKIIQKKQITQSMFSNILRENFDDDKFIIITQNLDEKSLGYCAISMDNSKSIRGYVIALPFKKCKLLNDKFNILMHEVSHLHTFLTNPKMLARSMSVSKINNIYKEKFYKYFLYSKSKLDEELVNSQFDKMFYKLKNTEKLDLLQYYRYRLKSEQNAYNQELQYYNKLNEVNIQQLTNSKNRIDYDFDNKIKYLEDKIRKSIKQMRDK